MHRSPRPSGRRPPPIVNLPAATKAVAGVLVLVHLAALVPALQRPILIWLAFDPRAELLPWLLGAVTYGLVHGSLMHLVSNLLGVVILGPLVERRHGPRTFLFLLIAGAIAGAAAHAAVQLATGGGAGLIGASASAAALIGWSLRQIRAGRGFGHLDQAVALYGILFIVFNAAGILLFRDSPVAYAAHAGGFAVGWLIGGWRGQRLRPGIQRR